MVRERDPALLQGIRQRHGRRLRIATARAVEGAIPDLVANRIIEQAITPAFRDGHYADGLNAGVDQILARLRGESLPLPPAAAGTPAHFGRQRPLRRRVGQLLDAL